MRRGGLAMLLALAACHQQTPAEKAAADARDIAVVEGAQKQKPPPRPITPQPLMYPDVQAHKLYGKGCAFVAEGGGMGAVLVTKDKFAGFKPKDEVVELASDPGSAAMPEGTWSRYVGKEYALTLTRTGDDTSRPGDPKQSFAGKLVVTDAWNQVVYVADGLVQCRA